MARPKSLDQFDAGNNIHQIMAQNAQYNAAGQMTHLEYYNSNTSSGFMIENRAYNFRNQLTNITAGSQYGGPAGVNLTYNFSATQNNGKITSMQDAGSGETVTYVYDELQRLVQADSGTTGAQWGMTWMYDGFGNRTNQSVMPGKAGVPSMLSVNPANNRITTNGFAYDANGNMTAMPNVSGMTYDVDNRLRTANGEQYTYDSANKRIWKKQPNGAEYWYLYGARGERLDDSVYFGGKRIRSQGSAVVTDRLGSVVWSGGAAKKYYPYGEERPASNGVSEDKFGTYFRDAGTGLDYADQRFYSSSAGRFTSGDAYQGSALGESPESWGRYPYVDNDPINYSDRSGLLKENCGPEWIIDASLSGPCESAGNVPINIDGP